MDIWQSNWGSLELYALNLAADHYHLAWWATYALELFASIFLSTVISKELFCFFRWIWLKFQGRWIWPCYPCRLSLWSGEEVAIFVVDLCSQLYFVPSFIGYPLGCFQYSSWKPLHWGKSPLALSIENFLIQSRSTLLNKLSIQGSSIGCGLFCFVVGISSGKEEIYDSHFRTGKPPLATCSLLVFWGKSPLAFLIIIPLWGRSPLAYLY